MTNRTNSPIPISALLALATSLPFGCARSDDATSIDELVLIEADSVGNLEGTIPVDDDLVNVRVAIDGDARVFSIRGSSGIVHAEWRESLADHDTVGSIAGRSFGRFEDADTDMDPIYWREVLESDTSPVLQRVAHAASLLAETERGAVQASLEDLAKGWTALELLATRDGQVVDDRLLIDDGRFTPQVNAECAYNRGDSQFYSSASATCSGGSCGVSSKAITEKFLPGGCTRTYYARLYRQTGEVLATDSCSPSWCEAIARHNGIINAGAQVCRKSKHWDSIVTTGSWYGPWCRTFP